jgi:hypothetical protein
MGVWTPPTGENIRTVCAECKAHVRGDPNAPIVSHGLCRPCFDAQMAALRAFGSDLK